MNILKETNKIVKFTIRFSLIIFLSSFIACDGPASDRVAHRKCKEEEKNYTLALLLLKEESKTEKTAVTEEEFRALAITFYRIHKECLNRWRISPKIIDPFDNLLWNGCGRCYK